LWHENNVVVVLLCVSFAFTVCRPRWPTSC
jgi:hypothetical protein